MDTKQTIHAFNKKWEKFHELVTSEQYREAHFQPFLQRYGWTMESFQYSLHAAKKVLDAGGGIGQHLSWFAHDYPEVVFFSVDITDISPISSVAALKNVRFIQADLRSLSFADSFFDLIYCDRVLMHIDSPNIALKELIRVLRPGGEICFSVYRKKGVVRESSDKVIRDIVSSLPAKEAIKIGYDLADLGRQLQQFQGTIKIPESLIKHGIFEEVKTCWEFIYWNLVKAYWNDIVGLEGSAMVNYEYYYPTISLTFSPEEVQKWCQDMHINIKSFIKESNAISVRGVVEK